MELQRVSGSIHSIKRRLRLGRQQGNPYCQGWRRSDLTENHRNDLTENQRKDFTSCGDVKKRHSEKKVNLNYLKRDFI